MKSILTIIAAIGILLTSCVTGYKTDDEKAAVRRQVLNIVSIAWKSGGKVLAQAELEKYIAEKGLDEAQAEFVRATASGIVEAIEAQAAEAQE